MIKGITVGLIQNEEVSRDAFNNPVYQQNVIPVNNVLVGEPSTDDVTSTLALYGKRVAYTLAIPKGDTHKWYDTEVIIYGARYRTIGFPTEGIEENIPLMWNKKVKVERYG